MEFKVESGKIDNKDRYSKDDLSIAYDFAKKVHKEFETFVRAVVLFGSIAKKKDDKKSDIDILLVIDDVSMKMSKELVQTYRVILEKITRDTSTKLHITTLKFTSFWEYARSGDPVAVNVLRDGVPIIDTGFFEPLQILLRQGRIRPTPESIFSYFNKAPMALKNSQWHVMQAVLDLYWAVVDSAHAALMKMNEIPPSPEHVADVLEKKLIKPGVLEPKYAKIMRNFYNLMKGITHGDIQHIAGEQYDGYYLEAEAFVKEMEKFINR